MRVVNEKLLDRSRGPGRCAWCGKIVSRREPHHIIPRGIGSASRLDVPLNIIPLCAVFVGGDNCHHAAENGKIIRHDLMAVVAARYGVLQPDVEEILRRMQRAPKECEVCPACEGVTRIAGGKEWDACLWCDAGGILLNGDPWIEEPRKPTWKP